MFNNQRTSKNTPFFLRFLRSVFAVLVLSSLVLLITVTIKGVTSTSPEKIAYSLKPLLSKAHINVDEKKVGEVAGKFVERISQTDLGSGVSTSRDPNALLNQNTKSNVKRNILISVAILSDIHDDTDNFSKALIAAKSKGVECAFVLGDLTNAGDTAGLKKTKTLLDKSSMTYYVIPGDHDVVETLDESNFVNVFGNDNYVKNINGIKFLFLDNSKNFTKISPSNVSWLNNNIEGTNFVLLSQPLYTKGLTPLFENLYMGSTREKVEDTSLLEKQQEVLAQATFILDLIRKTNSVQAIIAGDHHRSSELTDPIRSTLKHFVVGAVTSTVDEYPQTAIQSPRFSLLTIYEDGGYKIEDVVL